MIVRKIIVLAFSLIALTGTAAILWGQDGKAIRVETNLVNVDVAVRDEKGDFVENITKDQFDIFDNNSKRQIEYFSSGDAPVSFGIICDLHPTTNERTTAVLEALRQFGRELRTEDNLFVTVFDRRGSFTSDFVPTVGQVTTNLTGISAVPNSLYDAIYASAARLRTSKNLKRTLLVITDSADDHSRHSFSDLVDEFKKFDVQIYAVIWDQSRQVSYTDVIRDGIPRTKVSSDATSLDRVAMLELTLRNGGTSYTPTVQNARELYRIFSQIGFEMRKQYSLGFYPEANDGRQHQLKIIFRPTGRIGKGTVLSYRPSYQSPANR